MKRNKFSRYVLLGLAAVGLCLAGGCATKDTVSSRFPELQDNINAAKAADAAVYAPVPLKSAEDKLVEAKYAVKTNDMVGASRLVDEAMVDADYALAMAPTEKAKAEAAELRKSIQLVRDEIRNLPAAK